MKLFGATLATIACLSNAMNIREFTKEDDLFSQIDAEKAVISVISEDEDVNKAVTATIADSKVAAKADDVFQELVYRQTHEPCWVK